MCMQRLIHVVPLKYFSFYNKKTKKILQCKLKSNFGNVMNWKYDMTHHQIKENENERRVKKERKVCVYILL